MQPPKICTGRFQQQSTDHSSAGRRSSPSNVIPIFHSNAFGHVIDFVNSHEPLSELKHVVPQADDDELCILRSLLDVRRDN